MRWAPIRLLAAYGLGAVLVAVPIDVLGGGGVDMSSRSVVAVVGGTGAGAEAEVGGAGGFVLDRDGQVIRIGIDGSLAATASLDHYSTPFGTAVAGRAVFGGVRCEGDGCDRRVAELAVVDGDGSVAATVAVDESSGWPSLLNGLALVGTDGVDGDTVWVNGGGRLHQVAVTRSTGSARVVDEVPWPGGEPCVIGGRLHDLAATGGISGRQGARVGEATTPPFRLVLRRWSGDRWIPVAGGATTMPDGQNAYCTPGGYEIRDATTTLARWTPATAWHRLPAPTIGGLERRGMPAEAQAQAVAAASAGMPWAVDHYNMCSAACGPEVRAHTREVVAWLAERHHPAALSLNEACYDDVVHLAGRLPRLTTGAAYSALDAAVGCPGAVKRFGNVVLVDAGLSPRAAWWRPFPTQAARAGEPCDHRRNECRGIVCVDAARVFCSAHLESPRRDPGVAEAQTREYLARVEARFAGRGSRVLAGDFNLDRPVTDDVLVPAGYRAAADGATVGTRPAGAEEIDRIYDDGPRGSDATVTSYCDPRASDHCYMSTAPATPLPALA